MTEDITRSRLAKIALAAWVNADPEQLPPEKMWIEHPNHDGRRAWDRVVAALLSEAERVVLATRLPAEYSYGPDALDCFDNGVWQAAAQIRRIDRT